MKYLYIACQILLGLLFVVSGAQKLHPFMGAMPLPPAESLPGKFMAVMGPTGWMKFIGLCELLGGAFVLYRGTVPVGLVFLVPVTVNILLYDFLIGGGGKGAIPGLVVALFELVLLYAYRGYFADILTRHAQPTD